MTGGELSALFEIEQDRQDREWLRVAALATFVRRTIWEQESIAASELLGWEDPEREAAEDAAFDADWEADMRRVQGHPGGH